MGLLNKSATSFSRITIVGCGAFGYALCELLAKTHKGLSIRLYDQSEEIRTSLKEKGKHPYFLTDLTIPDQAVVCDSLKEAVKNTELLVLAVPAQVMRKAVKQLKKIGISVPLLHVSKALELGTDLRMSEVIKDVMGRKVRVAALCGGMFSFDVAYGFPVGCEIACKDRRTLRRLKQLFLPTTVHVDTTTDIAGVEFGGAFKNVIAIGAGIVDGLGFGNSSKAFFVAKSLREIERLAVRMGARKKTFHTSSNAWIGDLCTTCFGKSRNRLLGEYIGKGLTSQEARDKLKENHMHAEGFATFAVVMKLLKLYRVQAPFLKTAYKVVYEGADPHEEFKTISLFQANNSQALFVKS